jgi:hypothetical protein
MNLKIPAGKNLKSAKIKLKFKPNTGPGPSMSEASPDTSIKFKGLSKFPMKRLKATPKGHYGKR